MLLTVFPQRADSDCLGMLSAQICCFCTPSLFGAIAIAIAHAQWTLQQVKCARNPGDPPVALVRRAIWAMGSPPPPKSSCAVMEWTMDHGPWTMDHGSWIMDDAWATFWLLSKSVASAAGRLCALTLRRPPCLATFLDPLLDMDGALGWAWERLQLECKNMQGMAKRAAS